MTITESRTTSLYERLGGAAAVDAAVELFYGKVLADPLLRPFFDGVDMKRQRAQQKAFLTFAFGGPNKYTGGDMRKAHAHLVKRGLGEAHFAAVAGHLQATLRGLKVAQPMIDEVMAIAASTHDDVLGL